MAQKEAKPKKNIDCITESRSHWPIALSVTQETPNDNSIINVTIAAITCADMSHTSPDMKFVINMQLRLMGRDAVITALLVE